MHPQPLRTPEQIRQTGETLARAFQNDPAFNWVFPDDDRRRDALLVIESTFVSMYAPLSRSWVTEKDGKVVGASLWMPPGGHFGWLHYIRNGLLTLPVRIGLTATRRLLACDDVIHDVRSKHAPQPRWYLDTFGTDPAHQGQGIGSRHLGEVLAKQVNPSGAPATLFTSQPTNVPFYERFGFEVKAKERIGTSEDGFDLWFMVRPSAPTTDGPSASTPRG